MSVLTQAQPVSQSERILVLDSLRGIAILGILLMNIPLFSLPGPVAYDPTLNHETGINYYLWYAVTWLFDGTQRAFFSMLFGAGIILFVSRQEKRLTGLEPADYFFRRQLWLIAFSIIDVYILLWSGDILFEYACFGMLAFTFRKLSPKALLITAGICLLFILARENRDFYQQKAVIQRGEAIAAIDTTKTKLTVLEKKALTEMNGFKARTTRKAKLERVTEANARAQGDYATVYDYRTEFFLRSMLNFMYVQPWDVLIYFFLGMAFFKTGVITGTAPIRLYTAMVLIGLPIGLYLSYIRVQHNIDYKFDSFAYTKNVQFMCYQLDRICRSLGLLGVVMLLFRSGWFKGIFTVLKPVGQMAFTNYLGQSLICGLIFNGYAFGLYGKLQRYETYIVVAAVWVFQIIVSNMWMRSFAYGPAEWVWRSLTYWKAQPFVKTQTVAE